MEADHDDSPAFDLLGHVLDPSAEIALSDDQVRASVPLSLARARRLLSTGCWDSAIRWLPDRRMRRPPLSQAAITGLSATYAAIAHYMLDQQRELRAWRAPWLGTENPTRHDNPLWASLVHDRISAYQVNTP